MDSENGLDAREKLDRRNAELHPATSVPGDGTTRSPGVTRTLRRPAILVRATAKGAEMERNGYAKPVLVSTGWLAENLGEEGLVVVEVDENRGLYAGGHIPGAVELDWKEDLQDP